MRARSLVLPFLVGSAVVIACSPHASLRPAPPVMAVAADAGAVVALTPRQCTPFIAPASAEAPVVDEATAAEGDRTRRRAPKKASAVCETADSNLARVEAEIARGPSSTTPVPRTTWDRKTPPSLMDLVSRRLAFTTAERDLLAKNGLVVLERSSFKTYAWAFHEIYQSQLPLYVSSDAILHAVYVSNDHLIADFETKRLAPLLGKSLAALHCTLGDRAQAYPRDVARDLDLYITVARSLLADQLVPSVFTTDDDVARLVTAAKAASGIADVELFGRTRRIDWSAYLPRGHYADGAAGDDASSPQTPSAPQGSTPPSPAAYFRGAMWLSRLEFNLVSRSSRSSAPGTTPDPRETPREALVALALTDLVDRAKVESDVALLERAWSLLAGRREDVSIADLAKLRAKAEITTLDEAAAAKLRAAIGNDFQRTARLHPMPEGSTVLPAITTFLGPRVTADNAAIRPLVHSEVPDRHLVGAADMAYVLGLDHAKTYLAKDLAVFPTLQGKLDEARAGVRAEKDAGNLYGAWLRAVAGVAEKPKGVVPSFMESEAYRDLTMNTMTAGYGQIRHNYVLMAGQAYDEGGCVIPDAWVEPAPAMYEALAAYAQRGATVMGALDPKDESGAVKYFAELGKVVRVLRAIVDDELAGRPLSLSQKQFLSMIVEMSPGSSGGPPTYTGWYFDVFRGRSEEALAGADFIADFFTSGHLGKVAYLGAGAPRLGVFVVDTGGAPRVMVGPVAHAYETTGPVDRRFTDASARDCAAGGDEPCPPPVDKQEAWAARFTAAGPPAPAFAALASLPDDDEESKKPRRADVVVRAGDKALPAVTVEIFDHHRTVLATATFAVGAGKKVTHSFGGLRAVPQGYRVRIGQYSEEGFRTLMEAPHTFTHGGVQMEQNDWPK